MQPRPNVLVATSRRLPATVRATLLFEDGPPLVHRTSRVPPTSRFNLDVAAMFPDSAGRRFATLVESIGPTPSAVVAERSVYTGGRLWEAGTNAAGILSPLLGQPDLELFVGQAATAFDVVSAGRAHADGLELGARVAGVSLDPLTGRLTVTPGSAGAATMTLTATRGAGADGHARVHRRPGWAPSCRSSRRHPRLVAVPCRGGSQRRRLDELFGTARRQPGRPGAPRPRRMGLGPLHDSDRRDNRVADFTGDGRLDMVRARLHVDDDPRPRRGSSSDSPTAPSSSRRPSRPSTSAATVKPSSPRISTPTATSTCSCRSTRTPTRASTSGCC